MGDTFQERETMDPQLWEIQHRKHASARTNKVDTLQRGLALGHTPGKSAYKTMIDDATIYLIYEWPINRSANQPAINSSPNKNRSSQNEANQQTTGAGGNAGSWLSKRGHKRGP